MPIARQPLFGFPALSAAAISMIVDCEGPSAYRQCAGSLAQASIWHSVRKPPEFLNGCRRCSNLNHRVVTGTSSRLPVIDADGVQVLLLNAGFNPRGSVRGG